jgi:hypothetical protein
MACVPEGALRAVSVSRRSLEKVKAVPICHRLFLPFISAVSAVKGTGSTSRLLLAETTNNKAPYRKELCHWSL